MSLLLKQNFEWPAKPKDIATAVELECVADDSGVSENAMTTAENAARMLGRLIECLHTSGKLSDDEVCAILGNWSKFE